MKKTNKVYVFYEEKILENRMPKERYESWYTRKNVTIESVRTILEEDAYPYYEEVEVDFNPDNQDFVYVLYITYSDGDTFGISEGNIYIVSVHSSYETAKEERKKILEGSHDRDYMWTGYFSRNQEATIVQKTLWK